VKYMRNVNIMKNNIDRVFQYNRWKAEGLEQGKAEGKSEVSLEIARKMKAAGRPINEIEEFTGLSSDTIEQMSK